MTRRCSVTTCNNTYRKTKNVCVIDEKTCTLTSITYHTFPRDPDLRLRWIKATGRINWSPVMGNSYICSEHFKESDYDLLKHRVGESSGFCVLDNTAQVRRVLKRTAVPSQQLGCVIVSGDSEVYLKEDHYSSSAGEFSDASQSSDEQHDQHNSSNHNHPNPFPRISVKRESELQNDVHTTPTSLTSTVTIKEESEDSDKYNGIFEPEISLNESNSHVMHLDQIDRTDYSNAKRIKHESISPIPIKIERPLTPLDTNMNMEEKYEKLLDQYLMLKREYDFIKFKYDKQKEAVSECERILRQCR